MRKIFTLLFLVFAAVSAMADNVSFTVMNTMTTTDANNDELTRDGQTVKLTQVSDDKWELTFVDLALQSGALGDLTFEVDAKYNYGVYNITTNSPKATVKKSSSPYNGYELTLQMNYSELSPNGVGNQTLDFELYSDDHEDFYAKGLFEEKSEEDDGMVFSTYFLGKSGETTVQGGGEFLLVPTKDNDIVNVRIAGLPNVDTEIVYDQLSIDELPMTLDEANGSYNIKAENVQGYIIPDDEDADILTPTIKSIDITVKPDYGGADFNDDDDFGGVDPGMGDNSNPGTLEGTLVLTDPTSGKDFTYTISTDESILTAIKGIKAGTGNATEIYSVDGTKLSKLQKGLNIVRANGKTMKIIK